MMGARGKYMDIATAKLDANRPKMFGTMMYLSPKMNPQQSHTELPKMQMHASGTLIDAEHPVRNTVDIVVNSESDPAIEEAEETNPQNRSALVRDIMNIATT